MSVPSDIEIARAAKLTPILELAERIGLVEEELIPFGRTKAKVHLDALKRIASRPRGSSSFCDVSGIYPDYKGISVRI